jgi:DnaK suppressor protein
VARQSTLLRLHENLLARKESLGKKLAGELAYLHDSSATDAAGDMADLAFAGDGDEISSRLAELGVIELSQIDRALAHWNQGTFGICENCQKPILLARLNALPYTPFCINCVREMEKSPDGQAQQNTGNWSQISDTQALVQDQRINLAELEIELYNSRYR